MEKPILSLDPRRYVTAKDRLEFFQRQGYYFTNYDITESRDHVLDNSEFVYPVYRITNSFGALNVARALYDTYYNPRYGTYMPLNKYKSRLAAVFDRVTDDSNPDAWYYYAWYVVPADILGDMTLPSRDITAAEFDTPLTGASLVSKALGEVAASAGDTISNAISWKLQLALLAAGSVGLGFATLYLTGSPKLSLFVGVGTLAAGSVAMATYSATGIWGFLVNRVGQPTVILVATGIAIVVAGGIVYYFVQQQ